MNGSGLREREEGMMWSRNLTFMGIIGSLLLREDQVCS